MAEITVLGAGGWGMALAISAFNNRNKVNIWSPFSEEVDMLLKNRTNEKLLRGVFLPDGINITNDISVVKNDDLTVIATPSTAVREVAKKLSPYKSGGIVVNVSKGFESETLKFLSEVIQEELPSVEVVALSGPSHAEEVARNIPTSIVAASKSRESSEKVQDILSGETLRIYTSEDIMGVELGGALKNVIAIAAGFCDGLGLGDNTKAALITRGLSEMTRLGVCMGAKDYTFAGLAGIGDLVVTCTSRHSRNNRFGYKVGSGVPVKEALTQVGTVEGYYAADIAYKLGCNYGVEMPIVKECYEVLYENFDVSKSVSRLMNRPTKSEH